MNNAIELAWAKLPSFPQNYHEANNDGLIAFLSFVPKVLFSSIKPFWEGYIEYEGKKVALYRPDVVEILLQETYLVNLDGTYLDKPVSSFPGSLIINKIINVCQDSNNKNIAKMGYKQRQLIIYSQIKKELWVLFTPSDVIEINDPHQFKTGLWTTVKANKYEKEFDFDLNQGFLHYEDIRKNEDGAIQTYHRIAKLKNENDLPKLVKLVIEYKKYGKNVESFDNFDFESTWNEGFIVETFEPKKITPHNKKENQETSVEKEIEKDKVAVENTNIDDIYKQLLDDDILTNLQN